MFPLPWTAVNARRWDYPVVKLCPFSVFLRSFSVKQLPALSRKPVAILLCPWVCSLAATGSLFGASAGRGRSQPLLCKWRRSAAPLITNKSSFTSRPTGTFSGERPRDARSGPSDSVISGGVFTPSLGAAGLTSPPADGCGQGQLRAAAIPPAPRRRR